MEKREESSRRRWYGGHRVTDVIILYVGLIFRMKGFEIIMEKVVVNFFFELLRLVGRMGFVFSIFVSVQIF